MVGGPSTDRTATESARRRREASTAASAALRCSAKVAQHLADEVVRRRDAGTEIGVAVSLAQHRDPAPKPHPVGAEARSGVVGLPSLGERIGILVAEVAVPEDRRAV